MRNQINFNFEEIIDLGWKVEFGRYPKLFNSDTKQFRSREKADKWIEEKTIEYKAGPKEFLEKLKKTIYGDIESIQKKTEDDFSPGAGD